MREEYISEIDMKRKNGVKIDVLCASGSRTEKKKKLR